MQSIMAWNAWWQKNGVAGHMVSIQEAERDEFLVFLIKKLAFVTASLAFAYILATSVFYYRK